jgi:hypothetical protein
MITAPIPIIPDVASSDVADAKITVSFGSALTGLLLAMGFATYLILIALFSLHHGSLNRTT